MLGGNSLEGLFSVHDGQRNQNRPRPRGNLINVEVEPLGKENNLRRNGGHRVVVVLAQRAEIHLGEGVAGNRAAVGQNPFAALGEAGIVAADAHQLGRGVALDREREVTRSAGIDAPTAVLVLVAHHLRERATKPARIAAFQKCVQEDVVGFEHRVGFEFPVPIAVWVLPREQVLAGADNGRLHIRQVRIHPPEAGRRELGLLLLNHHMIRTPQSLPMSYQLFVACSLMQMIGAPKNWFQRKQAKS